MKLLEKCFSSKYQINKVWYHTHKETNKKKEYESKKSKNITFF